MTVTTKHGAKQHPLLLISRQAADTMQRVGAEFGLSPISRLRLSGIKPPPEPSKFDDLLA